MPLIQSRQVSTRRHAATLPGETSRPARVRVGLLALSGVLGIYALWQLAAVSMQPAVPYFIAERAPDEARKTSAAVMAAQLAQIRGDFWFDAAMLTWAGAAGENALQLSSALDDARAMAAHSARLEPHDARAWFLLALLDSRLGREPQRQIEALKMSYYTGPNDLALIPSRLQLAVRSPAIVDPDFQTLVAAEVLSAMRRPSLYPALVASYRGASAEGRRFLESSIGGFDPGLLANIRTRQDDPLRY